MADPSTSGSATGRRLVRRMATGFLAGFVAGLLSLAVGGTAGASPDPFVPDPISVPDVPSVPEIPSIPLDDASSGTGSTGDGFDLPQLPSFGDETDGADGQSATIGLELPDVTGDSSNAVVIILLLTVLSVAPSLLILTTSFTRIVIVMSLTRNALGIPQLPPQQVIVGLSIFLSLFIMGPTLETMNEVALQPLMAGELSFTEAADAASDPLREFMLKSTREPELEMFLDVSGTDTPVTREDVPLTALIPAFVLSELKSAFILGFVIFVPFMVIDIVVSAVLTSLGMMMLPPTFVSLPLKLLLFILLDGWTLIVGTVLSSYQ